MHHHLEKAGRKLEKVGGKLGQFWHAVTAEAEKLAKWTSGDIDSVEKALLDPAAGQAILEGSLLYKGPGEPSVEEWLRLLDKSESLVKSKSEPGVGDNVKPLAEVVASRADLWYYLQVAHHLVRCREALPAQGDGRKVLVAGLVAPAGGGKSTLVNLIRVLLCEVLHQGAVEEVSIDDFLSSQAEREGRHIKTRWDAHSTNEDLADKSLSSICALRDGETMELPLFNKARDDRLPEKREVKGPIDFVLFEGWRVGVNHPSFFGMNSYLQTLVYLESDFEAVLNFKLENIKRDIEKSGYDLYEKFGGVDCVFEDYYFAVARRYIVPVMQTADLIITKDANHHVIALQDHKGRWLAQKERQLVEDLDAIVIGGGPAGCDASQRLKSQGLQHVVLEDSPNIPDLAKEQSLPVIADSPVFAVTQAWDGRWIAEVRSAGKFYRAPSAICAMGGFHSPTLPPFAKQVAADGLQQLHSSAYNDPNQLQPGAVLVVGSGPVGCRLTRELCMAGREVYLSLSPDGANVSRRIRGRSSSWWLWRLGKSGKVDEPAKEGEFEIRFREMSKNSGLHVLGTALGTHAGAAKSAVLEFDAGTVKRQMNTIESNASALRQEVEALIKDAHDPDLASLEPMEEEPTFPPAKGEDEPIATLDLASASITTVIWATGYDFVVRKLVEPKCLGPDQLPNVAQGGAVVDFPGLFFLGLPKTQEGDAERCAALAAERVAARKAKAG